DDETSEAPAPSAEAQTRESPEAIAIDMPAEVVSSNAVHTGSANEAAEEITDYRNQIYNPGKKTWIVMGTVFLALVATGTIIGLNQKGVFNGKDNDPVVPAPNKISSISFAGYEWPVKQGGPKDLFAYTDDAVFVDSSGNLNLKVLRQNDVWKSTEVKLGQSLGYGEYEHEIRTSAAALDTQLVSSSLIYADDSRALNIALSKWLDPSAPYASSFSVEPTDAPGNHFPFQVKAEAGFVKYRINWTKESILFQSLVKDVLIASFNYTGKFNFAPGDEAVVLKHWIFNNTMPADQHEHSMVIKSFSFKPQK
ncbi:MAG: hypothetical protein ABIQ95_05870, partial [Bdellovibrionia bacterium]